MSWEWQNDKPAWNLSSPYEDMSGYQDAYAQLAKQQVGFGSGDRQGLVNRLNSAGDQFKSLFKNFVGRDATNDELDQFYKQNAGTTIANSAGGLGRSEQDPTNVRNQFSQYISDTFQDAAKKSAQDQLTGQQGQATSLADQYRQLGQNALDSTSQYLLNYQKSLFDKLQPQIQTSLVASGNLDSGAYNEALAGAQKDLASQAQSYLADANMNIQNQANQIQFGGASAPYLYQQQNIMNQVPYLQSQGANALGSNYNTMLDNLDFSHQVSLQNNYFKQLSDMQPSMLSSLGQHFVSSFGQSAGTNMGNSLSNGANYLGKMALS